MTLSTFGPPDSIDLLSAEIAINKPNVYTILIPHGGKQATFVPIPHEKMRRILCGFDRVSVQDDAIEAEYFIERKRTALQCPYGDSRKHKMM